MEEKSKPPTESIAGHKLWKEGDPDTLYWTSRKKYTVKSQREAFGKDHEACHRLYNAPSGELKALRRKMYRRSEKLWKYVDTYNDFTQYTTRYERKVLKYLLSIMDYDRVVRSPQSPEKMVHSGIKNRQNMAEIANRFCNLGIMERQKYKNRVSYLVPIKTLKVLKIPDRFWLKPTDYDVNTPQDQLEFLERQYLLKKLSEDDG